MYLPHDISCDFKMCEHVNLRREWMRAVFEELFYAANSQKIPDRKKVDYQEDLEKSHADSATRGCNSYMKDPNKSLVWSPESYMKNLEKSRADSAAQSHKSCKKDLEKSRDVSAAQSHESYLKESCTKQWKLHEGSGKDSCWQCSTKPWNLWEKLGEESLKWN